jgi:hypothetical protein
MTFPRTACVADGCHRGTRRIAPCPPSHVSIDSGRGRHEWLCADHWRRIPKTWKKRRRKLHKRIHRNWPEGMAWDQLTADQQREHRQLSRMAKKLWRMMKARLDNPFQGDPDLVEIERRFGLA